MNIRETNELAHAINAKNAHMTQPAEAAADVIAAVILAALAIAALLHFLEPCKIEGALCAAAISTKSSPWPRLLRALKQWYLQRLLASVEAYTAYHQGTAILAPQLEKLAQQRADELRVQLIDLDLAGRTR